jgi:hypothetical protein
VRRGQIAGSYFEGRIARIVCVLKDLRFLMRVMRDDVKHTTYSLLDRRNRGRLWLSLGFCALIIVGFLLFSRLSQ